MDFFRGFIPRPADPFPNINGMRYVPPCESDEFDEHGTPVGYHVDAFGNKIRDDVRKEYKAPFVDIFEATKGFYRDSDVIDVTFEEIKEDEC